MPPARDLRRGSRAVAHGEPPGGRLRRFPVSRAGAEPARTGTAGFQPASRAGGSMPPARDLRRGSQAVAHAAPPGGRLRRCPLIGPNAADAASGRIGAEPARTGTAGFQPASRAGGSMPPARDLRRGSRGDRRCRAAGRTTAQVPSDQLRRRRRGIGPHRRRAGWKAGDPSAPSRLMTCAGSGCTDSSPASRTRNATRSPASTSTSRCFRPSATPVSCVPASRSASTLVRRRPNAPRRRRQPPGCRLRQPHRRGRTRHCRSLSAAARPPAARPAAAAGRAHRRPRPPRRAPLPGRVA